MQIIPVQNIPTQVFNIALDGNEWEIGIRTTNGTISVTLTMNGEKLLDNTRAVAGKRIIPYDYIENGNFVFITQNFEIPDYTKFGITQQLVYISPAELAALRSADQARKLWTSQDFDPNGGLPQRFAPQGYRAGFVQYQTETGGNFYVSEDGLKFYIPS